MKTPEDEAFDDIERRQGGGFKAKQAMAADKLREPEREALKLLEDATRSCNNIDEQRALDALMRGVQPAQEPADKLYHSTEARWCENFVEVKHPHIENEIVRFYFTQPVQRPWVGLTDEDRKAALLTAYKEWECEEFLLCAREDYLLIEQALKEKNT